MSNENWTQPSSLDEKRNGIFSHWKYLADNIDPMPLLDELDKQELLAKRKFVNLSRKQRSHQVSLILISAYKNIQKEEDFVKFRQSVQQVSVPCAERLDKHVSTPLVEVDDIVLDRYRDILTHHRLELESKLQSLDLLDIVNDFIEASIFNIDDLEKIVYSYPNKESSAYFLDVVISNLKRNAFDCLIKSMAKQNRCRRFEQFLSEVNKSAKTETSERLVTAKVTGEIQLSPSGDKDFIKISGENIPEIQGNIRKHLDLTWIPANILSVQNSPITIDLSVLNCTLSDSSDTRRITKHVTKMLERIYSDKAFQDRMNTDCFGVNVTINITGKDGRSAVPQISVPDILAVNKSFLMKEMDIMTLTKAFGRKGIHCLDSIGLDTKTERRHMAEMFVAKLQSENLTNQLLQILEEEKMDSPLGRLKKCQKAYSSYTPELMNSIFRCRKDIVEKLERDVVRNTFVERNVFSEKFFDDLEEMFHDNEVQLKKEVVREILSSGPFAMMTLLDVLYINKLDKLAENIIKNEKKGDTPMDLESDRKQGIQLVLTYEIKLEDIQKDGRSWNFLYDTDLKMWRNGLKNLMKSYYVDQFEGIKFIHFVRSVFKSARFSSVLGTHVVVPNDVPRDVDHEQWVNLVHGMGLDIPLEALDDQNDIRRNPPLLPTESNLRAYEEFCDLLKLIEGFKWAVLKPILDMSDSNGLRLLQILQNCIATGCMQESDLQNATELYVSDTFFMIKLGFYRSSSDETLTWRPQGDNFHLQVMPIMQGLYDICNQEL